MNVSDAMTARKSVRAFTDEPIDNEVLESLLAKAARAPSGGNVQPWRIFVINGDAMSRFRQVVREKRAPEPAEYAIYPDGLKDPYRTARFNVGEQMYALLNIPREDKPARLRRLAENFNFFGAPAAIFCYVDRQMGPPQWSDLGMFLQSFMLLATEAGYGTCAQEAWANRAQTVTEFVEADPSLMLFCGIAIGKTDTTAPVNSLVSERFTPSEFATFV